MKMLVNPGRVTRIKRRRRKRARTAKQKAATRRMLAARKRQLSGVKANPRRQAPMAKRKRRRRSAVARKSSGRSRTRAATVKWSVNPRRRRRAARRRFSRNPSMRGVIGTVVEGFKNGLAISGGRIGVGYGRNLVSTIIPDFAALSVDQNKAIKEAAVALTGALVIGSMSRSLFGRYTPMVVGGAFSRPVETLLRSFGIEQVNTGLSSYPGNSIRTLPGVSSYPSGALPYGTPGGAGSYPTNRIAALAGDPPKASTPYGY